MGKRSPFPMKLSLLPGLRWRGKLTVDGPNVGKRGKSDGWLVQWDAEEADPKVFARFIYDRAILTSKQVKAWTGVDLEEVGRG
jgi:hypothetical protein